MSNNAQSFIRTYVYCFNEIMRTASYTFETLTTIIVKCPSQFPPPSDISKIRYNSVNGAIIAPKA